MLVEQKYVKTILSSAFSIFNLLFACLLCQILDVSAIVLANLCVSYIMTSQNAEAEELMKKIEKEEEAVSFEDQDKKLFHLCIVNLVIGTLYCSKGNYEFGISRVMKSLEPYNKKLGTDTWFYAKRCFLSLLEQLAKQLVVLKDSTLQECTQFLEHCEGIHVYIHRHFAFEMVFA